MKKNLGCTSHCHGGNQYSNQQDTKLCCANKSKVQQKNCDIKKKKMKWQVKKKVTHVSKNINSIELKSWHLLIQVPWLKSLDLIQNDKLTLEAKQCLNDKHILAAHQILHQQFDKLQGFQSTLLEQVGTAPEFSPVDGGGDSEGKHRLKFK